MGQNAIHVEKMTTSPIRVRTKAKLKPAPRKRYIRIKISWRYGKAHSLMKNNSNVPLVFSNHGEMSCAPLACANYLSLTDVIPKISPSPDTPTPCAIPSATLHCWIHRKCSRARAHRHRETSPNPNGIQLLSRC